MILDLTQLREVNQKTISVPCAHDCFVIFICTWHTEMSVQYTKEFYEHSAVHARQAVFFPFLFGLLNINV